jgi:hypothetical protein
MDLSRCSRAEEAFEEQNPCQNDLTEHEAHTRCCEAEGNDDGHTHWPSALIGTSPDLIPFSVSQPGGLPCLDWLGPVLFLPVKELRKPRVPGRP